MKTLLAFVAALIAVGLAAAPSADVARACGTAGPFDFDTFEAEDYVAAYADAINLATAGAAITSTFTAADGEVIDLRYQGLEQGSRATRSGSLNTAVRIPPTLYKSIVWIESNYTQASSSVPFGGVGPALRSFDCGYGLGQITSGMSNSSGVPTAKQAVIGTHYLFNLAEGVRILAEKWNQAPGLRPVAGNGDPAALEDWYFAIWSYNGFAFSNHPLNPMRNPLRGGSIPETEIPPTTATATPSASPGPSVTPSPTVTNPIHDAGGISPVYHCFDRSAPGYQAKANGQPLFGYGDYTYPERVYGCVEHPPKRAPIGSPTGTPATIQFWDAIDVSMPNFSRPEISAAFDTTNFIACENRLFNGGCPDMDFPTSFASGQLTHADLTPLPASAAVAAALGSPSIVVDAPAEVTLRESAIGVSQAPLTVSNAGTWVAPFRIRTSAPWIVVRHANDGSSRTLDGGVAVGADTQVVTRQASAGPPPVTRVAQAGYASELIITANPLLIGASTETTGTVWIEPLLGGTAVEIAVTLEGHIGVDLPFRRILPWISSEPTD